MLVAGFEAKQLHGPDYMISGTDGVHPGWAGQVVMAHAFLKALGLTGEIGLNRFVLRVTNSGTETYRVTWGDQSRVYAAAALESGVNLADDFAINPFTPQFQRVDEAVARKQAYETRQIKDLFRIIR